MATKRRGGEGGSKIEQAHYNNLVEKNHSQVHPLPLLIANLREEGCCMHARSRKRTQPSSGKHARPPARQRNSTQRRQMSARTRTHKRNRPHRNTHTRTHARTQAAKREKAKGGEPTRAGRVGGKEEYLLDAHASDAECCTER